MKLPYVFGIVTAIASTSFASSIGLFADSEYTSCHLNIAAPPGVGTLYVVAIDCANIPGVCPSFTGAEFRIEGLPPGWIVVPSPSPAADLVLGDPFGTGANIAFYDYQTSNRVLLYTVNVWPVSVGAEATLHVTSRSIPSHPNYVCPVARVGDCPADTQVCVEGGQLFVNQAGSCTVAVAQVTWSKVRGLYR